MLPLFLMSQTQELCRHQYLDQLRPSLDLSHFARVSSMEEDGLYLHKRHIRGDHGKMLEQAGTALLHTVVYLKNGKKVGQFSQCFYISTDLLHQERRQRTKGCRWDSLYPKTDITRIKRGCCCAGCLAGFWACWGG